MGKRSQSILHVASGSCLYVNEKTQRKHRMKPGNCFRKDKDNALMEETGFSRGVETDGTAGLSGGIEAP